MPLEAVVALTPTAQVTGTLAAHTASVEAVRFCDVMPYAATASVDGSLLVWDVQVCELFCPFPPRSDGPDQSTTVRQRCDHGSAVSRAEWAPGACQIFR